MARLIEQLTSAIRLVTEYPQGLSMLLGAVPPPGCDEICEMLESVRRPCGPTLDPAGLPLRVDGGRAFVEADARLDGAAVFDRVIGRAGGWKKINTVTQGWAGNYPKHWRIVADHAAWIHSSPGRLDGRVLQKIAVKNRVCESAVSRTVNLFPQRLATAVLNTIAEGEEFTLGAPAYMKSA
jgi:hypothetical protein